MRNILSNKGQSMVEFVMVLPIFLILVLGMIEFGLVFNAFITINNGSREGARLASLGGSDGEIETLVDDISGNLDLANITVDVSPSDGIRQQGDSLEIVVTYQYDMITPLIGNLLGGSIDLEGITVMRME